MDVYVLLALSLFLVVGLGTVVFGVLNARYEINRRYAKRLGAAFFGDSALRRFTDYFADSGFGRVFYGSILTIFLVFAGITFVIGMIAILIALPKALTSGI